MRAFRDSGKREPKKYSIPYGMTEASLPMRNWLATVLTDLINEEGIKQTAYLTGVSNPSQGARLIKGKNIPYHDWTLSQIERAANAYGLTFTEMMDYITQHKPGLPVRKKHV